MADGEVRTFGRQLRSLLASAGLYAAAGLAQRGIGFILIPIYTRVIDPVGYGMLEVLNAFSGVVFAVLTLGLVSAINKVYHRDCPDVRTRQAVLGTALVLVLPSLLGGAALVVLLAGPLSRLLVHSDAAAALMPLVATNAVLSGVGSLAFAALRAQERALAFGVLTLAQFVTGLTVTIVLVVAYGWGIGGILWGGIAAQVVSVPLALTSAQRRHWGFDARLVRPLLAFGVLIVPSTLGGWVIDQSDRYLLGWFRSLDEVGVYGVGYRFGSVVDLLVVWPFQMAWPAFSFAISREPGHRVTYARALTYLACALSAAVLIVAVFARHGLGIVIGARYAEAADVLPLIGLAYALNGVHYCVAPGLHLSGRTRYLPGLVLAAALLNLAGNVLLIPPFGMVGAALATVLAFLVLAAGTWALSHRAYPVPWEYGRLVRVIGAAGGAWLIGTTSFGTGPWWAVGETMAALLLFPLLLFGIGFLEPAERQALRRAIFGPRKPLRRKRC